MKMGVRLGCHPESPHLLSPSFNAHTIAELQSQTQHLAPLHQAMAGAHIADSPGAAQGALEVRQNLMFICRPDFLSILPWLMGADGRGSLLVLFDVQLLAGGSPATAACRKLRVSRPCCMLPQAVLAEA